MVGRNRPCPGFSVSVQSQVVSVASQQALHHCHFQLHRINCAVKVFRIRRTQCGDVSDEQSLVPPTAGPFMHLRTVGLFSHESTVDRLSTTIWSFGLSMSQTRSIDHVAVPPATRKSRPVVFGLRLGTWEWIGSILSTPSRPEIIPDSEA